MRAGTQVCRAWDISRPRAVQAHRHSAPADTTRTQRDTRGHDQSASARRRSAAALRKGKGEAGATVLLHCFYMDLGVVGVQRAWEECDGGVQNWRAADG